MVFFFLSFSYLFIFFSDTFDCVATVFFIDTAHCIISYIETIFNILKPGGYWINLGKVMLKVLQI